MQDTDELLTRLLKNVSRSFYLTLRVLPDGLRTPVGLAYLLARAADTIADTAIVPPLQRLELLLAFRAQVCGAVDEAQVRRIESALQEHQADRHERVLLQSLLPALTLLQTLSDADRAEVRSVVHTLTQGMELDLGTFPLESSGQLGALETLADLDRYVYLVAGCVGEFWTRITVAHTPALRHWDAAEMSACGIRFGKALQLTNVLRDCPKDLRNGRCYLPREELKKLELRPEELLLPENGARARPLLVHLLRLALDHYRQAQRYTLAIPSVSGRLRLACLWPVLIGLPTLEQLAARENWLDPKQRTKVSRGHVYRTLALSLPAVGSDTLVATWIEALIRKAESRLMLP